MQTSTVELSCYSPPMFGVPVGTLVRNSQLPAWKYQARTDRHTGGQLRFYLSGDFGRTWGEVKEICGHPVVALHGYRSGAAESDEDIRYFARTHSPGQDKGGIWMSADFGKTWTFAGLWTPPCNDYKEAKQNS